MFKHPINIDKSKIESFFLLGSRQSGKSTLLRSEYPDARWIDLLNSEQFIKCQTGPHRLRECNGPRFRVFCAPCYSDYFGAQSKIVGTFLECREN